MKKVVIKVQQSLSFFDSWLEPGVADVKINLRSYSGFCIVSTAQTPAKEREDGGSLVCENRNIKGFYTCKTSF